MVVLWIHIGFKANPDPAFFSMWIRIQGAKQCRSMQIQTMVRFLERHETSFISKFLSISMLLDPDPHSHHGSESRKSKNQCGSGSTTLPFRWMSTHQSQQGEGSRPHWPSWRWCWGGGRCCHLCRRAGCSTAAPGPSATAAPAKDTSELIHCHALYVQ